MRRTFLPLVIILISINIPAYAKDNYSGSSFPSAGRFDLPSGGGRNSGSSRSDSGGSWGGGGSSGASRSHSGGSWGGGGNSGASRSDSGKSWGGSGHSGASRSDSGKSWGSSGNSGASRSDSGKSWGSGRSNGGTSRSDFGKNWDGGRGKGATTKSDSGKAKTNQPVYGNVKNYRFPDSKTGDGKHHKGKPWDSGHSKDAAQNPSSDKGKPDKEHSRYGRNDPPKPPVFDPEKAKKYKYRHHDHRKHRRHGFPDYYDTGDFYSDYYPDDPLVVESGTDVIDESAGADRLDEDAVIPGPSESAWSVHTDTDPSGGTTCVAVTYADLVVAQKDAAPNRTSMVSVTDRPKEHIHNHFSASLAHSVQPGSEPIAIIGPQIFNLVMRGDEIFAADPVTETRLVQAMKDGATMTIRSDAKEGGFKHVEFSLIGLTAALDKMQEICRP
jgi:hypothetical protein